MAALQSSQPIGVFDSGFGGLSVLRAIRTLLPHEDLIYCGDHARLPYGERSGADIRARARAMAQQLVAAGCKALVIACNTATAAAAADLRAGFEQPVIGMEPAIKPAVAATRSGVIGVLGTGETLASARFAGLLTRHAGQRQVVTRACPELVIAVEQGGLADADTQRLVATALAPLLTAGADAVVLGCTHFPFLRAPIEAAAGDAVRVIDTGPAVARQVRRRLEQAGLATTSAAPGRVRVWTTGSVTSHRAVLARLWGEAVELEAAPVASDQCAPQTERYR